MLELLVILLLAYIVYVFVAYEEGWPKDPVRAYGPQSVSWAAISAICFVSGFMVSPLFFLGGMISGAARLCRDPRAG